MEFMKLGEFSRVIYRKWETLSEPRGSQRWPNVLVSEIKLSLVL